MKNKLVAIRIISAPFFISALYGVYWAESRWIHAWTVGGSLGIETLVMISCALVLLCSIEFLRLKNWARSIYMGMTALGVCLGLALIMGPFLVWWLGPSGHELTVGFVFIVLLLFIFPIILGIMTSIFFMWAFVTLRSEAIKQHFAKHVGASIDTAQ